MSHGVLRLRFADAPLRSGRTVVVVSPVRPERSDAKRREVEGQVDYSDRLLVSWTGHMGDGGERDSRDSDSRDAAARRRRARCGRPSWPPWVRRRSPRTTRWSAEKVELGKLLFFDPILSGNYAMPCAVCHFPEAGWSVRNPSARATPVPSTGATARPSSTPPTTASSSGRGSSRSLESQARSAARGAVAGTARTT